jgi:hypothetical protein
MYRSTPSGSRFEALRGAGSRAFGRSGWALPFLAVAGALVCAGQVLTWSLLGAWPFHDTADFWLAGRHVLEGGQVYRFDTNGYLNFIYGPPWAILWAAISLLPLQLVCGLLLAAQVAGLRYIAGSWTAAGLLCWVPFVPREFVTGNIDFLMGAAILAGMRGRTWPVVVFAFAKIAPAFVLIRANRRQWLEATAIGAVLVLITLPWIRFWPQWMAVMLANPAGAENVIPALIRIPLALVLGGIPRPWAFAAAVGLLTPSFHIHTPVVLIPAIRLWWDQWNGRPVPEFGRVAVRSVERVPSAGLAARLGVGVRAWIATYGSYGRALIPIPVERPRSTWDRRSSG